MPVHKVKGGWQWGNHGKIYKSKAEALRQARAAFAHGYRGKHSREEVVRKGKKYCEDVDEFVLKKIKKEVDAL